MSLQAGIIFTVHALRSVMSWDRSAGLGQEDISRAKLVAPGPNPVTTAMYPALARAYMVSTASRMRGNPAATKGGGIVAGVKFDHLGMV